MQTWSNNGIFKPKLYTADLIEHESLTIDEAFFSPKWTKVAQQEYDALVHNQTWELVSLPPNRRAVGLNGFSKSRDMWMALWLVIKAGLLSKGIFRK